MTADTAVVLHSGGHFRAPSGWLRWTPSRRLSTLVVTACLSFLLVAQPVSAGAQKFFAWGNAQDFSFVGKFTLAKRGTFTVRMTEHAETVDGFCYSVFSIDSGGENRDHFRVSMSNDKSPWSLEGVHFRRGKHTVWVGSDCVAWTITVTRTGPW